MKFPKINVKKLLVKGARALVRKYGDEVEARADAIIDAGADKLKQGVAQGIKKAK